MNNSYILSQMLVAIAYIVLGIGIRKEKRMHLLIACNIYTFILLLSYLILGAVSGVISCSVSIIQDFIYMYYEKTNKTTPKFILYLLALIVILLTIIFYESPIDFFPCALTTVTIFAIASRSTKVNRLGSLFSSVCWIIYALAFKSWFVIICESYLAICAIIGLLKYNYKKSKSS